MLPPLLLSLREGGGWRERVQRFRRAAGIFLGGCVQTRRGCCKTPRGWRGAQGSRVLWTTPPCGEAVKGHCTPPIWAELSGRLSLLIRSLHPAAFHAGFLPRIGPGNARAARSSGFLGPTWEGERQGAASRESGLARSRSPLLHDSSLESELRQADRSVIQVRAPKRPVWGTRAPPLHTHQRRNSLMNFSTAVVHHQTAAAREASLEKQDPHLAKRRLWTWSQKMMCEVMLSQRRALD